MVDEVGEVVFVVVFLCISMSSGLLVCLFFGVF